MSFIPRPGARRKLRAVEIGLKPKREADPRRESDAHGNDATRRRADTVTKGTRQGLEPKPAATRGDTPAN